MTEKMNSNNKFTYNDGVIIKKNSPKKFHPGESGIICGLEKISTENEAKEFFCEVGDWVYIVEFSDGSSIEVSENHLEEDQNILKYCLREKVVVKGKFSKKSENAEVVTIIDFHKISTKILAEKINLKLGDYIYVVESQSGEFFLIPETYIESRIDS